MKPIPAILLLLCGTIAGGIIVHLSEHKTPPAAAPMVASSLVPPMPPPPEKIAAPKPEPPPVVAAEADAPAETSALPVAVEAKPDDATNSIHQLVDALLTAKSAAEKHNLFQQLLKDGKLDAAMAELQQRAADNPNDPEIPTTLGEALLNKVRALHDAGGDQNEMGILAMQADQSFNAALKIDPANYEAQLVKSISQTYWPADPARDGQVVQTLAGLIDRQETMTPQPDFAQTYLYLGKEYQKIGQPDKAAATFQLGLAKFPNDPALLKIINGP
jgi:tetratricopeptide (TPR) repeat protein